MSTAKVYACAYARVEMASMMRLEGEKMAEERIGGFVRLLSWMRRSITHLRKYGPQ